MPALPPSSQFPVKARSPPSDVHLCGIEPRALISPLLSSGLIRALVSGHPQLSDASEVEVSIKVVYLLNAHLVEVVGFEPTSRKF